MMDHSEQRMHFMDRRHSAWLLLGFLLLTTPVTLCAQSPSTSPASASYEAICLDLAPSLQAKYPAQWAKALATLNGYPKMVGGAVFRVANPYR